MARVRDRYCRRPHQRCRCDVAIGVCVWGKGARRRRWCRCCGWPQGAARLIIEVAYAALTPRPNTRCAATVYGDKSFVAAVAGLPQSCVAGSLAAPSRGPRAVPNTAAPFWHASPWIELASFVVGRSAHQSTNLCMRGYHVEESQLHMPRRRAGLKLGVAGIDGWQFYVCVTAWEVRRHIVGGLAGL